MITSYGNSDVTSVCTPYSLRGTREETGGMTGCPRSVDFSAGACDSFILNESVRR